LIYFLDSIFLQLFDQNEIEILLNQIPLILLQFKFHLILNKLQKFSTYHLIYHKKLKFLKFNIKKTLKLINLDK